MSSNNNSEGRITRRQFGTVTGSAAAAFGLNISDVDAAKIIKDAETATQRSALRFKLLGLHLSSEDADKLRNELTQWVDGYLRKSRLFREQADAVQRSTTLNADAKILYEPADFKEYPTMSHVFSRIEIVIHRSSDFKGAILVEILSFDKGEVNTYSDAFVEHQKPRDRSNERE